MKNVESIPPCSRGSPPLFTQLTQRSQAIDAEIIPKEILNIFPQILPLGSIVVSLGRRIYIF